MRCPLKAYSCSGGGAGNSNPRARLGSCLWKDCTTRPVFFMYSARKCSVSHLCTHRKESTPTSRERSAPLASNFCKLNPESVKRHFSFAKTDCARGKTSCHAGKALTKGQVSVHFGAREIKRQTSRMHAKSVAYSGSNCQDKCSKINTLAASCPYQGLNKEKISCLTANKSSRLGAAKAAAQLKF